MTQQHPPTESHVVEINNQVRVIQQFSGTQSHVRRLSSNEVPATMAVNIPYTAAEIFVAFVATIGNILVIVIFCKFKKTRKETNYYILSLALADLLVGLFGIPFALLTSVGLPEHFFTCKVMLSVLVVLCTISILSLLSVSIDRFWAILYPLAYKRIMHSKTIIRIIVVCWILGTLIGLLPVMGWNQGRPKEPGCYFTVIMNYQYLVFIYFGTIVLPSLMMAWFYCRIYAVVLKQLRQISSLGFPSNDQHRRIENKKEVNAAKNLFIIVVFFVICWTPLYTINTVNAFCEQCITDVPIEVTYFSIILSHANSAVNPFLYAFYMKDFRAGIKKMFWQNSDRSNEAQIFAINSRNVSQDTARVDRRNTREPIPKFSLNMPSSDDGVRRIVPDSQSKKKDNLGGLWLNPKMAVRSFAKNSIQLADVS